MTQQVNIGDITENMRMDNHERAQILQAICAASTWPECFVVSSFSPFLVTVPERFFYLIFFVFFCLGWYCEVALEIK